MGEFVEFLRFYQSLASLNEL